jgi:hypothetical protein
MTEHERDPQIYHYLRDLPEPELPAQLWQRIDSSRRRRQMRSVGIAAAASLAAMVIMSVATLRDPSHAPQIQANTVTATNIGQPAWLSKIRALDQRLQAAYEFGADAAEVDPLWEARRRALNQIDLKSGDFPAISLL